MHANFSLSVKLLLVLASTVKLGPKPHGTHDHTLPSDGLGNLSSARERESERERELGGGGGEEEEEEEEEEEKRGEVVRDTTFGGSKKERIYISGFEGSQAVPARPSDRRSAYALVSGPSCNTCNYIARTAQ
jgi:hypothetical protein